jgi:hypothetical protein
MPPMQLRAPISVAVNGFVPEAENTTERAFCLTKSAL